MLDHFGVEVEIPQENPGSYPRVVQTLYAEREGGKGEGEEGRRGEVRGERVEGMISTEVHIYTYCEHQNLEGFLRSTRARASCCVKIILCCC